MTGDAAPVIDAVVTVGALTPAEAVVSELPPAPPRPRRLVYLGTPEMAVPALEALVAAGLDIALVVTRVDKRRGRGSELSPSPVKAAAERLGLPVAHSVDAALAAEADLGVVVAFGQLIRRHILEALPMVNLHFSLLPRWRGAAPVERALMAGDTETGVCLMRLEEGLDTGGIYARTVVPIGPTTTAADLRRDLVDVGTGLLVEQLAAGLGDPVDQVGDATYAAKLDPAEFQIDWSHPAVVIDRLVRVGQAWTAFRGKRLKVLQTTPGESSGGMHGSIVGDVVTCGEGSLHLRRVQPEGKAPMMARDWANGARPGPDERLGD